MRSIEKLIICSPYEMPAKHHRYDRKTREFEVIGGRRPAGFVTATKDSQAYDDPGVFHEIELVNRIRLRVDEWRKAGYPGVTGATRQLLDFWNDSDKREHRFFFCQMEAIETLIWLTEAHESEKLGIDIPSDGGGFGRLCCKMATGTGKTVVMAMLIAWQAVNKAAYPDDPRFSRSVLVVAPGLTVWSRLKVLRPEADGNFYRMFNIVPEQLYGALYRARVVIYNWHKLVPETDAPKIVTKLGRESDAVFARRILGHDMRNVVVINDEAHHAYRASPEDNSGMPNADAEKDRVWMEGLDMVHSARNVLKCFDFSATPSKPTGDSITEETMFKWIVSDFGLSDAIESGLTKTPRITIGDDSNVFSEGYKSRLYHIYANSDVRPDLSRNSGGGEGLPGLVENAYRVLGQDWIKTRDEWEKNGSPVPPVMITVCNNTNTSRRVERAFEKNAFDLKDLSSRDHMLRIDTVAIRKAEEGDPGSGGEAERLRDMVDTVGKRGKSGEQVRNIIAVKMLSEGWDARNVTHIMGLRAFASQLLCEQVVGRGLRRVSYDVDPGSGLLEPEYVNVFGVPFTFLPHEGGDGTPPPPAKPTTEIRPDPGKSCHKISWPNVERIDTDFVPKLEVDWGRLGRLDLRSDSVITRADMAQILAGKPHRGTASQIGMHAKMRMQKLVFQATARVYESVSPGWRGRRELLLAQVAGLVGKFIRSDKLVVVGADGRDDVRWGATVKIEMSRVVSHMYAAIKESSTARKRIDLSAFMPVRSTSDMRPWNTTRQVGDAKKSHINMAVYDKGWERSSGSELDRNSNVVSWAKNDLHMGFLVKYLYKGVVRDYVPDFLIRLKNDVMLVLEVKGRDDEQNEEKRKYMKEWVEAVNDDGRFGAWAFDVAFGPSEIRGILSRHAGSSPDARLRAKCPRCARASETHAGVEKDFGFRSVGGIIRPQSWCRKCRSDMNRA